jgi:selenium metabolism protein YedF
MTTIVDARGELCPRPLILTRQALKTVAAGAPVRVLVDNETSHHNVARFLRDHGAAVDVTREGATITLAFAAPALAESAPVEAAAPAPTAAPAASPAGWVVALAGDTVGRGAEELGRKLAGSMLATLPHVEPRPSHVVLYSSAVLLAVDGAPTAAALAELERLGIQVLLCGTCVDYYEARPRTHVGTITDMLRILGVLAGASKVVAP